MTDTTLDSFHGERLTVLRDLEGLTQEELAKTLGVTQGFLSRVEKGTRPFPASIAAQASSAFSVPLSFFGAEPGVAGLGPFTFRKKASARMKDEKRVTALYTEAARLFHAASVASGYRTRQLPDSDDFDHDPELCSAALRTSAGLSSDEPVKNVARLLELHGIGVITRLDDSNTGVSDHVGISRPTSINDRPLVATVQELPGAVQRLSLGHEAGHWVFDGRRQAPVVGTRSLEEARAFQFGGGLLLPEPIVRQRVSETLSLHGYMRIKADYGISISAIIRRAKDLGVITPARYRSLSIQLSSQGWRYNEPVEVPSEEPQLLRQALHRAYGPHPVRKASEELGISPVPIQRWIGTVEKDHQPNVVELQTRRSPKSGDPS